MRSVTRADRPRRRLPAWAVAEGLFGVRLFDVGIVALVIAAIEINASSGGPSPVTSTRRAMRRRPAWLAWRHCAPPSPRPAPR
ncbi:MAG: hypothetical protein ACRDOA_04250 [Streptosporangiaceae bacterium]